MSLCIYPNGSVSLTTSGSEKPVHHSPSSLSGCNYRETCGAHMVQLWLIEERLSHLETHLEMGQDLQWMLCEQETNLYCVKPMRFGNYLSLRHSWDSPD